MRSFGVHCQGVIVSRPDMIRLPCPMRLARNPQGSTPSCGCAPARRFETCAHGARIWQPKNRTDRIGRTMRTARLYAAILVVLILTGLHAAADRQTEWPRWRGPHDDGSTTFGTYPVHFDARTLRWRTPLPGKGCSTPIVWNRSIYLTAPVDGNDAIHAIDWSGRSRWSTVLGRQTAGKHRNGSGCNASPATELMTRR